MMVSGMRVNFAVVTSIHFQSRGHAFGVFRLTLFACCLALLFAPATHAADEWPAFRGPAGDGHSDAAHLPLTWSDSQNITWQTPFHGKAWSSPVVSGNDVWLTTATEDGKELSVLCISLDTGAVRIDRKIFDVENPPDIRQYNTYASPTPVTHEGRLYATWGSAGTACLDMATGDTLWTRRDLPCNHYRGAGSSPIVHNNKFFLNYDGFDFQYVVALDIATGNTVWKIDRPHDFGTDNGDIKKSFATPLIITAGGREQLISATSKGALSYDPETGHEIWRVSYDGFSTGVRPLFAHGLVYLSAGQSKPEILAVRPDGKGDVTATHIAWSEKKQMPSKPSPLIVGDLLFVVHDKGGVATCLDALTGQRVWQERIGGNYTASPLYADGRIYFFCEDGKTIVIRAAREFEILAENHLGDGFWASPAVAGNSLLLRSATHLYRLDDASPAASIPNAQ